MVRDFIGVGTEPSLYINTIVNPEIGKRLILHQFIKQLFFSAGELPEVWIFY